MAESISNGDAPNGAASRPPAVDAPGQKTCTATAPSDPPLWERSLPTSQVSSDLPAGDPRCVHETGRSAQRVTWRNVDGTFTTNMYAAPVNFRAADGKWQGIDTRLHADANGGFANQAGPFSVHLARTANDDQLVSLSKDGGSLALRFDGQVAANGVRAPEPVAGVVGGDIQDTLTFVGALPNAFLRYQVLPSELKEVLQLDRQPTGTDLAQYRFTAQLDGFTARRADDGTIEFVDAAGKVAFAIPAGTAIDGDGATAPVTTTLAPADDGSSVTLTVSVDGQWLADPARAYPVTIDPSFTATATSDAYVNSSTTTANCNGSCQYNGTTYVDKAGISSSVQYRTFLQYPSLSSLTGTYIQGASWYGYAYASSGTTPFTITLQPPSASWSASTVTWANQPAVRTNSSSFSYGGGTGWVTTGITGFVQNWTATSSPWGQYGIRVAGNTSGANAMLSFVAQEGPANQQSYLQITYDAYPTLSNLTADGQYSTEATPSTQPFLSAQIDDVDSDHGLTGSFEIWNTAHTGSALRSGTGTSVGTGEETTWQPSTALSVGSYDWRVKGNDGIATSDWSGWKRLIIDQTAPNTPTISIAGVTANAWVTPTGSPLTATFGDSSTDMQAFEWGLDVGNNPTDFVDWDSGVPGATVDIEPTWGWHDLAVRAIDTAGNPSASVQHFTFGWGEGGFTQPAPETTTQRRITAQVNSDTSYTGVKLQWRRADTDSWTDIPTGDVTYQSSGTGIGSWPVSATPGTNSTTFPPLVWDAKTTASNVDGPLQLRAGFHDGSSYTYLTDDASIPHLHLDQAAFGSGYASTPAGPGTVNLLTGNLELDASDVSLPGGSVSRTFQSRAPTTSGDVFGPGWSSSIGGASAFQGLVDNANTVVITTADGSQMDFALTSNSSYPYTYDSPAGSTDLTLTKTSSTEFTLAHVSGVEFGFTNTTGNDYRPSTITDATAQTFTTAWNVSGGITKPTQITAPPPTGVNCSSSPLTTRGCQTVTFDYATTTQTTTLCGSPLGDYAGQLRTVSYTAWDPDKSGGAGMNTFDVATYCYDSSGMLRAEWDPRISPALKTQYTYNGDGQLATLTPSGQNAWNYTYAPLAGESAGTGRLSTAYRAEPGLGNATTTFVYDIPLATGSSGPYDMTANDVATWGQRDLPTDATAVFPPDQTPSGSPPSSYTRATVYYLDAEAQLVNTAEPGGYIDTTEYDDIGNPIRTLDAGNRAEALAGPNAAWQTALAGVLSTDNLYDSTGVSLVDTYGPAHQVKLPDGTRRYARAHAHYVYDQGSPGGATYNLVTTQTESAAPLDGTSEQDSRTTSYAYNIGGDTSGWTLGTPLQTIVDPGAGTHLHLTTTTLYDTTSGNLTARIPPANPSGGDAHETDFVYYTSGTNALDASCGNHPEWEDLACDTKPAAQPGGSLPNLPTTQVTAYNVYGQLETTVETNGADTRTVTISYDAAGRPTSHHVTGTGGAGTSLPTTTTAYDTSTGLPYTTTDGTRTVTRTYDALARLSSYQDADGNTSSYTYDLLSRLSTLNDGKGTATYTYDDVGTEHRGLPTTIDYGSGIGSFTATYDPGGRLVTQTYPGGLEADYTYDEIGETTNVAYSNPGHPGDWPFDKAEYDIHGERASANLWDLVRNYNYDAAGRLTQIDQEGAAYWCYWKINYTLDADTNRTATENILGCPGNDSSATTTYSYDSADRITTTGTTYDKFGRTLTVPAANAPIGTTTTQTYYVNDLVSTIASNGITLTHNLDPSQRLRTFVSSASSAVHTNHYTDDNDAPAWTSENTAGTSWTRWLPGFNGLAATVDQSGTVTNQLANVHGDIVDLFPATSTNPYAGTWTQTDEWGYNVSTASRYDYVGTAERKRDINSGLMLMGARLYNSNTGRFLQTDPELGGSANSYDYASGDPVNNTDPTGRQTKYGHWIPVMSIGNMVGRSRIKYQGCGSHWWNDDICAHAYVQFDWNASKIISWCTYATKGWCLPMLQTVLGGLLGAAFGSLIGGLAGAALGAIAGLLLGAMFDDNGVVERHTHGGFWNAHPDQRFQIKLERACSFTCMARWQTWT